MRPDASLPANELAVRLRRALQGGALAVMLAMVAPLSAFAVSDGDRADSRAVIERQIDWLYGQRFARDVTKQLRFLRRQLDAIEKRIGAV